MHHAALPTRSSSAKRPQTYAATHSHTSSCLLADASEQDKPTKRRLLDEASLGLPGAPAPTLAATLPAHGRYVLPNLRSGGLLGHQVEDAWECRPNVLAPDNRSLQSGEEPLALFAVYDGHCGAAVSKLCVARLHQHLRTQLREAGAASSSSRLVQVMPSALRAAFLQTDADARRIPDSGSGGSTATVAVVSSSHIWVAYCGDSRAVIGSGARVAETSDQKACRDDERARIEGAGGCVLHYQGTLRVMGVLACTRAIGDHDLDGYGVTAEPEVLTWERHPGDECLILASDGLWDKVGSQEAVEVVRRVKERCCAHPNAALPPSEKRACASCSIGRAAAQALAKCARGRNSRDDITVLVVNLEAPCSCLKLVGAHNTSTSSLAAAAGSGCASAAAAAAARARSLQAGGSGAAPGAAAVGGGDAQALQQLQQQLMLPTSGTAGSPRAAEGEAAMDAEMLPPGGTTGPPAAEAAAEAGGAGWLSTWQAQHHAAEAGAAAAGRAFPGAPPAASSQGAAAGQGLSRLHAPSSSRPAAAGGGKGGEYVDDMRCTPPPGCPFMPRAASPAPLATGSSRGYLPGSLTVPRSPTPTTTNFMRLPKALSGGLGGSSGLGTRSSGAAAAGTGLCMFGQVSAAAVGQLWPVSRQLQTHVTTPSAAVAAALGAEPALAGPSSSCSKWPSPLGLRPVSHFAPPAAAAAGCGPVSAGGWLPTVASEGCAGGWGLSGGGLGHSSPQQRLPSSCSAPPNTSAVLSPFGLVSYGLAVTDYQLPPPALAVTVPHSAAAEVDAHAAAGPVLLPSGVPQQVLEPSLSVQHLADGVTMPLLPVASGVQLPLPLPGSGAAGMAHGSDVQQHQMGPAALLCTDAAAAGAGADAGGAAGKAAVWSVPGVVVPQATSSMVVLVPTPPNLGSRHSSIGRSPSCGLSVTPAGDAQDARANSCDVPMLVTSS